jgi:hypothetical protein
MGISQVAEFSGLQITIHDRDGTRWVQLLDVGRALGYAQPHKVGDVYRRHADEFTDRDTCTTVLVVQGQRREVRLFSETGCVLLTMFANTPRAKDFRAWAKRVLAGELPPPATAATSTVEGRLDNIEHTMQTLAGHMAVLVEATGLQARKLDVVGRYIALLELNQRGRVKVTRALYNETLALKAEGMGQADIARLLRLSPATVNLIVHGKFPLNEELRRTEPTAAEASLGALLDHERAAVLAQMLPRAQA